MPVRRVATGELLLFLHADSWLAAEAIEQIRTDRRIHDRAWGGFCQRIENQRFVYRLLEQGNAFRVRSQGLVYGDQALFVARRAFEQVGGFPDFKLMEDFEISRRLCKIERPLLLPGPVHINAHRWETHGIVRQTIRNWSICAAYRSGKSPDELAKRYRRHDQRR